MDNDPGIKPEVVRRILDFNVRVSDKAVYRSPTRGAQGNGLKTVLGIPYALGSNAPVLIEGQGIRHVIRAWADPAGNVRVDHREEQSDVARGTRFTVRVSAEDQNFSVVYWAEAFAVFNPHALEKNRGF
ncbi:hypothetical protein [Candidatus Desulforudis audaxviator]|uniref:Uncharacterized protein n=1 Tax=Desulforudis audaxviator (strain MP104C) TaxID=477974 RepID=B1I231_DESAP|nr:hypothetical protein [Candidatus Desulforudis audaxviator]ACA58973.1 hypothetical protein Daud_0425 [Candidatus Desulforudis audaxviator MP104C]AZK59008.1 hypothetical protein Daudx_0453 [Candidatus Desulforudis audaxviator]